MSDSIHPPLPSTLLPPLLAHIPSTLTSPTPPESLYPLLTHLLRSRVKLLSSPNNWASLLTWNATHGAALVSHLSTLDLTPHPSSGELELGHAQLNGIKRLDEETLNASLELADWGLTVIYTWSPNDPEGEDDAWRVLDVHASSCAEDTALWHATVAAAEEAFSASRSTGGRKLSDATPLLPQEAAAQGEEEEDDDDYWAMYDRSSAATPAAKELPNPPSEEAYFSQYDEVVPALDSSIYSGSADSEVHTMATSPTSSPPHAPRPLSAGSAGSDGKLAARLEEQAQNTGIQVEIAVKQHISTSLKSMYRLAKQAGIGREEFAGIINTEVSMLSMMDDDE
ncbi:hypothetical protein BZA05DRAFT_81219 [Tricharina praecox]|uniref:uncharacterized protein n=1 Tax=Tricharina praecox TaxID=43433 RepID=UPI00221E99A0|nr:uncharacterized protein BZA05DRAFT_81219 [Tricharina praecox]KAI5849041.1 hypothetical protein BZA05DRAFT_81219 [Tricharina praecox]